MKCLSQDYLIRKWSIPCETLHNFAFCNYKSSLILSEVAAISAYVRESTNEMKFFSVPGKLKVHPRYWLSIIGNFAVHYCPM